MGWCSQAKSQNSSMQLMNRHVFVLHVCVAAPVKPIKKLMVTLLGDSLSNQELAAAAFFNKHI